jgi:hypothetical protein
MAYLHFIGSAPYLVSAPYLAGLYVHAFYFIYDR